jgi:hypothetical protein
MITTRTKMTLKERLKRLDFRADALYQAEILEKVSEQIRYPSSDNAECREWSNWDYSGIYYVPSIEKCARVWIDESTHKATRCELLK